jgi:hypothetical protein
MKFTVVYPYKASDAQGDELKHSLRSLCLNFKEEFDVVIVGDKPDWLSDEARVISGTFDNTPHPAVNVAKKLDAVIRDRKMAHNFIWMNDDIYFINPVTIEDIKQLKHIGKTRPNVNYASKGNPYHINGRRTFAWLTEQGKENFIYSTHLPFWYNKANWRKLFALLPLMEVPYLLTNLYHNYFFKAKDGIKINHHNEISVGCYRKIASHEAMNVGLLISKTKFLNHSQTGYCRVIIEEIKRRFGNVKCRFEK